MPIVLTWNVYHGTLVNYVINNQPAATPLQRMNIIMAIANANNVDVVALQEVPNGLVAPGVYGNYTAIVSPEQNPNHPPAAQTTDNYVILYRTAWYNVAGAPGFYNPQAFNNGYAFLRPPFGASFVGIGARAGVNFNLLTWHNEANTPNAQRGVEVLDQLIGNPAPRTVVLGDFNLLQNYVAQFFHHWTDLVAVYPAHPLGGLDHILVNGQVGGVLGQQLDFVSDAYHYPVAGQF